MTAVLDLEENRFRVEQEEKGLRRRVSRERNGICIILYYIYIISLTVYSPPFVLSFKTSSLSSEHFFFIASHFRFMIAVFSFISL